MYRLIVLSVAVAAAVAGPLSADDKPVNADGCVSYDDKIQKETLDPFLKQMKEDKSEYVKVPDHSQRLWGFGLGWKNGEAGNFSSLELNSGGSKLCTVGNTKTVTFNLGFGDLKATFDPFTLYTPMYYVGGDKTTLSLKGVNLLVEISATTDPTSKKCTVAVESFLFDKWGSLNLDLGEKYINRVIAKLFNFFANTPFVAILDTFRVADKINEYAVTSLTPILAKHGDEICAEFNSAI